MIKYLKIETPFKRDVDGTKKLIEGDFRNKTLEFLENHNIPFIATEKIDGTNIQIAWDGHNIEFHGRTEKAEIPKHLLEKLNELFLSTESEELFEQMFGETPMILYGEGYGPKIQKGGTYRDDVSFILFDVYAPWSNTWLTYESASEIAKAFGIDIVPIIMKGSIKDMVEYIKTKPVSTFGTHEMEGLVAKPEMELYDRTGNRIITKIKAEDFN